MNKLFKIAAYGLTGICLAGFVACSSGGSDGPDIKEGKLVLLPSKENITANGTDAVDLRVKLNGRDVTTTSEIYLVDRNGTGTKELLPEPAYKTMVNGNFAFMAIRGNDTSNRATITAAGGLEKVEYHRYACVMKLTGTWCSFCPDMVTFLKYYEDSRPDKIIELSFHGGETSDPMLVPETAEISTLFGNPSFPAAIVDLREMLPSQSPTILDKMVKTSRDDYPAMGGIALTSTFNSNDRKVGITAKVKSSIDAKFRIAVYLIENGIVYRQLNHGKYDEEYVHNRTVRKLLSSHIMGDDLGTIAKGSEEGKTYTITLDDSWNAENMSVVAYTVVGDYINNVAECKLGGSIDYRTLNE